MGQSAPIAAKDVCGGDAAAGVGAPLDEPALVSERSSEGTMCLGDVLKRVRPQHVHRAKDGGGLQPRAGGKVSRDELSALAAIVSPKQAFDADDAQRRVHLVNSARQLDRRDGTLAIAEVDDRTATIEQLKDAIKSLVWSGAVTNEMAQVTINSRHQDALRRGREAVQLALDALRADASLEFVALDLRIGANAVGEVVGKTTTEDLLDSIFSTFCLGK